MIHGVLNISSSSSSLGRFPQTLCLLFFDSGLQTVPARSCFTSTSMSASLSVDEVPLASGGVTHHEVEGCWDAVSALVVLHHSLDFEVQSLLLRNPTLVEHPRKLVELQLTGLLLMALAPCTSWCGRSHIDVQLHPSTKHHSGAQF